MNRRTNRSSLEPRSSRPRPPHPTFPSDRSPSFKRNSCKQNPFITIRAGCFFENHFLVGIILIPYYANHEYCKKQNCRCQIGTNPCALLKFTETGRIRKMIPFLTAMKTYLEKNWYHSPPATGERQAQLAHSLGRQNTAGAGRSGGDGISGIFIIGCLCL